MQGRNSSLLWRVTGILSFLSFLLFAAGFVTALDPQTLAPQTAPAPSAGPAGQPSEPPAGTSDTLTMVALGDSLTRGAGDVNGLGYIGLVRQAIEKQHGQKVILTNLAINGSQSFELLNQLDQQQVQRQLAAANLILFTIGGNDLFKQSGGVYDLDKKKLDQAATTLASNFENILKEIRSVNSTATILYTALYDPFANTEAKADTTPPVLAWNMKAAQIASRYPGVIIVPTYDLFLQKEQKYLYTDHFHPNSDGYQRIAERILQALD